MSMNLAGPISWRRAIRWWIVVSLAIKLFIIAAALFSAGRARGQNSSLFHHDLPPGDQQLRLSNSSWVFQKADPPTQVRMHDLITIVVNEKSAVTSTGQLDRRKTGKFDAELKDWIHLDHLWSLKPSPMSNGQPKANGTLDSQYQADAELSTKDALEFKIAAEIVDIRPNGNLIIEAHHKIQVNEDVWVASLTGVVRREDVHPDNTVLSQNIAELMIEKREVGNVRDGYRRGWLTRLYDRFMIF
jgi:flagellar L-ring protein precursor FlgH